MNWQNFIGNEKTVVRLQNLLVEKRLPHALLFVGPKGIGKFLAATMIAAAIFYDNEEKYEAVMQHPDLHILKPEGQTIKIEQVRQLENDISLAPYEAEQRVIIIDQAESMTVQSANSLLKTLEEPIGNVLFMLIVSNRQMLLDTILSRCMVVDFQPISREVLAQALGNQGIERQEAAVIARLANGSLAKALEFLQENALEVRNMALECLEQLCAADMEYVWKQSSVFGEMERTKLSQILLDLNVLLRDILILNNSETLDLIYNIDVVQRLRVLKEYWIESKIFRALREVKHTEQMLKSNTNARLAMEQLMIKLSK